MFFLERVLFGLINKTIKVPIENVFLLLDSLYFYKNGLVPTATLSIIVNYSYLLNDLPKNLISLLQTALQAFPLNCETYWLLKTTRWHVHKKHLEFDEVDLLTYSIDWLDSQTIKTGPEQTKQIKEIIYTIEKLIKLRNTMEETTQIKNKS